MIRAYLPSAKLITIVVSLALAGGLVTAAQYVTRKPGLGSIATAPTNPAPTEAWQQTLEEIQLEAGITAPVPAPQAVVDELLAAAKSTNLTTSIGRTLLVNLSSAGASGLGSDIPTQDAIIEAAAAQVGADIAATFTAADVIKVAQTKESLYLYGNQLITTLLIYPDAEAGAVAYAFGEALDYQDKVKLAPVRRAADAYRATAEALMQLPVPDTLAPLHVQIANRLAAMGRAAGEMATVLEDPLRGLGGLQVFQSSGEEVARLLTTIAKWFDNGGILFTKDDPGAAWSAFLGSP